MVVEMSNSEERILVARAMSCGPGLRALRERDRSSLRDVAAQVSVHYSHLSRIERGLGGASLCTLKSLAWFYFFGHDVVKMLGAARRLQGRKTAKTAKKGKSRKP
jgi:transcriptional regulator with XRE-family HTH domain